jgi:hypothetical protein
MEKLTLNGQPVGIGQVVTAPAVAGASPWALALATSVVGAATGWIMEEIARGAKKRRR